MNAICKESLWEKCVFAPKFLIYRGEIKVSETLLMLILSEKNLIDMKPAVHYSFTDEKMLPLWHELTRNDKNKAQADRKCHTSWAS